MGVTYWEDRYSSGGNSGKGSRGELAALKAAWVNRTARLYEISSILDLGCGDGYVASMIDGEYLGLDPSPTAVELARKTAPQHRFKVYGAVVPRDAHLSLDVIRHLTDDGYPRHMADLFSARKVVMVWSSDVDHYWSDYEQERHWTPDVPAPWECVETVPIPDTNSAFTVFTK